MNFMAKFSIRCLLILMFSAFVGCAGIQKTEEVQLPAGESSLLPADETLKTEIDPNAPFTISDVRVSRISFNPTAGENIAIYFNTTRPSKAMVQIFDRNDFLVREMMVQDSDNPGVYEVAWDGRDQEGNIVPDEAYFFTIEANAFTGELTHYDPTVFSGGENFDFPTTFQKKGQSITYELSENSRVLIRGGISNGPLLKNLVNWEPRLAGVNQEPWDGKDASETFMASEQEGFTLMSDAQTLPENSILTSGNSEYTFMVYQTEIAGDRPAKESRPKMMTNKNPIDPGYYRPLPEGEIPRFYLKLPEDLPKNAKSQPVVRGKLPIKIILEEKVKRSITEQRYEIICYVDFRFITEQEEGYSPATWVLDTQKIPNGEHIITVNVVTFNGQMESSNCKIYVEN